MKYQVKRFSIFGDRDSLSKDLFYNLGNTDPDPEVRKQYRDYPEDVQKYITILRKYKPGVSYEHPDQGILSRIFSGTYQPNSYLWEDSSKPMPKYLYQTIPGTLILATSMIPSTGEVLILRWDGNIKEYTISLEAYGFDVLGKATNKLADKAFKNKNYYIESFKSLPEALENF